MAVYRTLIDLGGRFRLGSEHELPKGTAALIAKQAGHQLVDAFMPVAGGLHHSEKPKVVIRQIPQPLMLPVIPKANVEEIRAQIEELKVKLDEAVEKLDEAKQEHQLKHGLLMLLAAKHQFTGASKEVFDQLAQLREERDQAEITFRAVQIGQLANSQELARLEALLAEQPDDQTAQAIEELRIVAVELAQHDPTLLLDQRVADLRWRSSVLFSHGMAAADLHGRYCDLLARLSGEEAHRAVMAPAVRELAAWATHLVNAAVVG